MQEKKWGRKTAKHFCTLTCWIWRRSVHCTKAEPNPDWSGPGSSCSHHLHDLFLSPLLLEGWETLNGVGESDTETEARTPFCWPQPLCLGWPHPPEMARLRPRAEQDSRTPPTPAAIAACFTDLVQTRRIPLHEPRTTIVPPSSGLLLEPVHDGVIEDPQQATARGGCASLLLSYCCRPTVVVVIVAAAAVVGVYVVVSFFPHFCRIYFMFSSFLPDCYVF